MKVRTLVSGTNHVKYGPLERGLILDIDPHYYDKNLFDVINKYDSEEDIPLPERDKGGRKIPANKMAAKREKAFKEHQKTLKQYEEENKLALGRLKRRYR